MNTMKISVIIPVYNAEKYVSNAIESALQFEEVHEVILIEDNSPDNALEVCKKMSEKYEKVKLYQHPDKRNHGAGASRNLGIEKSSGEFIAFLDADDYFLPNRFDAEKELFKDPKASSVLFSCTLRLTKSPVAVSVEMVTKPCYCAFRLSALFCAFIVLTFKIKTKSIYPFYKSAFAHHIQYYLFTSLNSASVTELNHVTFCSPE
ncbi:glycosyltransferase family 2 protein [Chryseobacterium sp. ISL-6]|uniref:glycosyltransferase family 2 protein n=1 Tax=Chryseobacterium sp. ISL-6 TaxID=2819143 RepID=UPI002034C353|nr:glycosyltransferase family 2 protein [Chryseobacterium sp. ISL-6]